MSASTGSSRFVGKWIPGMSIMPPSGRHFSRAPPSAKEMSLSRWKRRSFRGGDDPAVRSPRWLIGFNDDLSAAGSYGGGNDVVVGQVEENGGSVGCDPGGLDQGSWSCSRLNAKTALIPTGPRAPLSSTTRTQFPINREEPVNELIPEPAVGAAGRGTWGVDSKKREQFGRRFFAEPTAFEPEHTTGLLRRYIR